MLKIMLIEDEKLERQAIKTIIERAKLDAEVVAEASNGLDALDTLEAHDVDVAFVDIRIPGIGGLDFIREARERNLRPEFIIVSAYDYFDYARKAIALGVREYLLKPVRREDICKILEDLIREHAGRAMFKSKKDKHSPSIDVALRYIEENYVKDISLSDVAEAIPLNSFYFSRHFKSEMGINFVDYLMSVRIEKAKEMLRETAMTITEIATAVGYHDSNYFSRVFRKLEGVSPRVYRQNN